MNRIPLFTIFSSACAFAAFSVALASSTFAQDSELAANLLPNSSFEEKTDDGVRGWCSRAWHGEPACQWSIESPGRTGGQCVSIQSDQGSDAAWTATVPVQPNTYYRLSGWIKTKDLRGAVGALLNIQNLQHVKTPRVTGTEDWTRVSTLFQTGGATQLEVNCLFGGWGNSTGQAWYDDVALESIEAPPENTTALVVIDTDVPSLPYSPMIFGGFLEHFHKQIYGGIFEPGSPLSDERGFRKDVIEAMKELKLSVVRWPGGCFASGYHWKDGLGKTRNPVPDPVWGVTDPNTFGTDEFVEWCRLVGCEPYICTNAGSGTPEEMRQWVEYCNATEGEHAGLRRAGGHQQPLGVKIWSVGNENWGGHEIGASTPEKWGPLVGRAAELMLGADPDLKLAAAATPNRAWTLPLLKAAGRHLNYVAVHQYWLGHWQRNEMPDYLTCIMHVEGPEQTIADVITILDEAGYRGKIKIAFDEWNLRGWHHPGFPRKNPVDPDDKEAAELVAKRDINLIARQYTMADALFSASFLNACLRHSQDVGMANIAPIVNTRGPLHVHPTGLVKRTTFHTLAMYANLLENHVAKLEVAAGRLTHAGRSVAIVDAVATVDELGKNWSIVLVNRHPSNKVACTVKMKNVPLDGTYDATILAGDSPNAYNDVAHPFRVTPQKAQLTFRKGTVDLPPHSLTIVNVTVTEL
jgi:alpha-N-arabinofuranosidase